MQEQCEVRTTGAREAPRSHEVDSSSGYQDVHAYGVYRANTFPEEKRKSETSTTSKDDLLNQVLAQHGAEADDWYFQETLSFLHLWADRFNNNFLNGKLLSAAISLSPDRWRRLGWFLYGRDGLALNYRVNLNTLHLTRKTEEVLATLLHELLHLEEYLFGKPGKHNYHNKAFRLRCEELGIPCDSRGYRLGMCEPFISLLRYYRIPVEVPINWRIIEIIQNPPKRKKQN